MNELLEFSAKTVKTSSNIQTKTTTSELTPEKTLWEAAKSGDILMLKKWIEGKKLSVDEKNEHGETPLTIAAQYADINTVKWLVDRKADIFIKNAYGATPDFIAAQRGDRQICQFLMECMSTYEKNFLTSTLATLTINVSLIKNLIKTLKDKHSDSDVRAQVASALGNLKQASPEVIDALIKALGNEDRGNNQDVKKKDVRTQAASALGNLKQVSPEVIDALIEALGDSYPSVRTQAASALVQLGKESPDAIIALIKTLGCNDKDVRTQVASALGNLTPASPNVIASLIKALGDPHSSVRTQATSALVQLGKESPDVIAALTKTLRDSSILSIRTQAASALVQLGKESPSVIATLIDALGDRDGRAAATAALRNLKQASPKVIDALLKALGSSESDVSTQAASALVQLGKEPPDVITTLIKAFGYLDSNIRIQATSALGNLKQASPKVIDVLLKALGDKDSSVRTQAASALGNLKQASPNVIDALLRALGDKDSSVGTQATSALVRLEKESPAVIDAMLKAFRDSDSNVRTQAASVLGNLKQASPNVIDALLRALGDKDSLVRIQAASTLVHLGKESPDVIDTLLKTFGYRDGNPKAVAALGNLKQASPDVISVLINALDGYVGRQAASALVQLGKKSPDIITAALIKALMDKDSDSYVRRNAISALGNLKQGSPEVIAALIKALGNSYPEVSAEAASALGNLKQASLDAIADLLKVLENKNKDARAQASFALGNCGQGPLFLLTLLKTTLLEYFDFPPETLNEFRAVEVDVHRSLLLFWKGCIKKGFVGFLKSAREEFSKDFNHIDINGNTWLHIAASFNQPDMVEFLIGRGMDPSLKNKAGQTAYEVALEKGSLAAAQMIIGLKPMAISAKDVTKELNPDGNPKVLGSGSFGIVYKAKWNHSEVAYKQLHAGLTELSGKVFEEFRSEVNLLAGSQHANVVRMYGITLSPLGLVMEWVQKGSLRAILDAQKNHKSSPFSWSEKIIISQDIAKGLTFLHSEQIKLAHRDLKADNVLLDENNHAELTDFGFAQVKSANVAEAEKAAAGSLPWIAPEALQTPSIQTTHSDMYSYGTVLWEITTLEVPYANMQIETVRTQVLAHQTPALPDSAPKAWNELIQKCWTVDPKERPTAPEAVKYLSEHRSEIVPSTQRDNAAVLHFKGLDNQGKNQQDMQTAYTHTTLNYLLPMLENTVHMILYAASVEEELKDIISHICILSKALGRPALVLFASSSGLTCGALIAGQQLIWVDPRGQSLSLEQRAIFETLLQEEVLEYYYVSKTPLLNEDWEMDGEKLSAQSGAILVEWSRGILQRSLTHFMSWVEKLPKNTGENENSTSHASIDIQALSSASLKTLQLQTSPENVSQQLQIFRQQHLAVIQLQPREAMARNEVSSEKEYVEKCQNSLSQRSIKRTIQVLKASSNNSLTFKVKVNSIRSYMRAEKNENPFISDLQELNNTLSEKTDSGASVPEIPASEIVLTKRLGHGNFGEVHKGVWEKSPVAVKRLKGENIPPNLIAEFKNEAELLASLNHPNIIHLFGICTDMPGSPFCVVLEFASGGSLDSNLRDSNNTPKTEMPSWELRQRLAFDIARGVAYLHKHKIIHGDLRACNILVDKNDTAKLGDFGLAKQRVANMSMVMTNERTEGFFNWLSPELLKTGKKTEASDVYSFGMILWELMTGKIPFDGYSEETIGNMIASGDILSCHPIPSDAPKVLATLMKKCLSRNPEDRPKMREVVETLFKALEPEEYKAYRDAKSTEPESTPVIEFLEDEPEEVASGDKEKVASNQESDSGESDTPEEDSGEEDTPEEAANHLTEFSSRSSFLFGSFFNPALRRQMKEGEYITHYLEEKDYISMACITRSSNAFFKAWSSEKKENISGGSNNNQKVNEIPNQSI